MEKGRLMLRSLLVAVAVLVASVPVVAQPQLWSATLTAGEYVLADGRTYIGYYDLTPIFGSSEIEAGTCTIPGLMKIKVVKKPAQRARKNNVLATTEAPA